MSGLSRKKKPYVAEFLVDTGAIDCMAPRDKLLQAGVRPERRKVYELANGDSVEYDIGFARLSFMGDETVAQVIFGPPHTEPILGVVALENVSIVVDPATQQLKRLHASPLK
jgi:clan AA aspartic protease